MEKTAPTRQELLRLKAGQDAIKRGLRLLKGKREALMKEFFNAAEADLAMREELTKLLSINQRRAVIAGALYGQEALKSFSHSQRRRVSLDIRIKNIWGVAVPEIEDVDLTRSLDAREISPIGEKALVLKTARGFERAVAGIVRLASKEIKLRRLGDMIKADTQKINAVTEVLLPVMKRRVTAIERVLEQREQEEIFRLKRYKGRRKARTG